MKTTSTKRIKLNREIVRCLNGMNLMNIMGGGDTDNHAHTNGACGTRFCNPGTGAPTATCACTGTC